MSVVRSTRDGWWRSAGRSRTRSGYRCWGCSPKGAGAVSYPIEVFRRRIRTPASASASSRDTSMRVSRRSPTILASSKRQGWCMRSGAANGASTRSTARPQDDSSPRPRPIWTANHAMMADRRAGDRARVLFLCTHNSARSQRHQRKTDCYHRPRADATHTRSLRDRPRHDAPRPARRRGGRRKG